METLRRATVYAQWSRFDAKVGIDPKGERVAQELLTRLIARAQETERRGVKDRNDALALILVDKPTQRAAHNEHFRHAAAGAGENSLVSGGGK